MRHSGCVSILYLIGYAHHAQQVHRRPWQPVLYVQDFTCEKCWHLRCRSSCRTRCSSPCKCQLTGQCARSGSPVLCRQEGNVLRRHHTIRKSTVARCVCREDVARCLACCEAQTLWQLLDVATHIHRRLRRRSRWPDPICRSGHDHPGKTAERAGRVRAAGLSAIKTFRGVYSRGKASC